MPPVSVFSLPEKVLQFGTGVLLRGLPDYFIDRANAQGIFNGRIVVVKSTDTGGADAFTQQDGLFTQLVRGIEDGHEVSQILVNSSISRVLSAREHWKEILSCAANPEMQVIISNTTEVGIRLVEDNIHDSPPVSFPGKLLAFLHERYQRLGNDPAHGMVIVPTELITDNGDKLREIVLQLAAQNGLDKAFIDWLKEANDFCNSLVDRIVPGKLPAPEKEKMEKALGYTDELMIMSECYRLWAIATKRPRTASILSFSRADNGVVLAPDITRFRELKLRLLNGSHTFSCGLAVLRGFTTVKEAMTDERFVHYISELMFSEIAPAITNEQLSPGEAKDFALTVLDRFRNPFIEHLWLNITVQYSSKMAMRNVPILMEHYHRDGSVPRHMGLGWAAYLLFMRTRKDAQGRYTGNWQGREYPVQDDHAEILCAAWKDHAPDSQVVEAVLGNTSLWGSDLRLLPGFAAAVTEYVESLRKEVTFELFPSSTIHS